MYDYPFLFFSHLAVPQVVFVWRPRLRLNGFRTIYPEAGHSEAFAKCLLCMPAVSISYVSA